MNTCGNCHYFEPIKGQRERVGHCMAEPPLAFAGMAPGPLSVLSPDGSRLQPVVQSMERPVAPTRRACRHWETPHG
jgi:hypothetical protein